MTHQKWWQPGQFGYFLNRSFDLGGVVINRAKQRLKVKRHKGVTIALQAL